MIGIKKGKRKEEKEKSSRAGLTSFAEISDFVQNVLTVYEKISLL